MPPRRQGITTVNRLLAVLDQPAAATTIRENLLRAGFVAGAVEILLGHQDADRIDSAGNVRGGWTLAWRILQFTQTDQMVDLAVYEAALRDGRAVITVHTRRSPDRDRAQQVLQTGGAHFLNFFGRLATEEITRWRGTPLRIASHLRR